MQAQPPTLIVVSATTKYMKSRSNPEAGEYAFGYAITIRNEGQIPAKLIRRHWVVTSDNGKKQEMRGEGVVGETPRLEPGGSFKYNSWTLIETPTGHMEGRYLFVTDEGRQFWTTVHPFFLEVPGAKVIH